MVSQEREISHLWYPGSESVITDESNTVGGGGVGGLAFLTLLKSCGLPEVSLGFPLLPLIPSRVPILPG